MDGGDHLEAAMGKVTLEQTTVEAIIEETAAYVLAAEKKVFEDVLNGKRVLPFSVFATHLFKAAKKFHIITPNYDRLIELAVESAGFGVDSGIFGYVHGQQNPRRSADAHREAYYDKRTPLFVLCHAYAFTNRMVA